MVRFTRKLIIPNTYFDNIDLFCHNTLLETVAIFADQVHYTFNVVLSIIWYRRENSHSGTWCKCFNTVAVISFAQLPWKLQF